MTLGMVLGKFLPPHHGHEYLINFAKRSCDSLIVVVSTLSNEPIPGARRFSWMRELCPDATVMHLSEDLPQHPDEDPMFWARWRRALLRVLPRAPDFVFAGEDYGGPLAQVLGARFVPVDRTAGAVPISGSAIRQDPMRHWDFLPAPVKPWFARRVRVIGPECAGKTTLARTLAARFQTNWVPEYARSWLAQQEGMVKSYDMPWIVRGQIASEEALARQARRLLVCDTDPTLTVVWSEALFGSVDPEVTRLAQGRKYAATLLLEPWGGWVADPMRYQPDPAQRARFFDRCRELYPEALILSGSWDQRLGVATEVCRQLLERPTLDGAAVGH